MGHRYYAPTQPFSCDGHTMVSFGLTQERLFFSRSMKTVAIQIRDFACSCRAGAGIFEYFLAHGWHECAECAEVSPP